MYFNYGSVLLQVITFSSSYIHPSLGFIFSAFMSYSLIGFPQARLQYITLSFTLVQSILSSFSGA